MEEVNLKKIQCIPHHQTMAIMNNYLISSVDHINKVADYAENQMMEIDFCIDELQAKVDILQMKLGIQSSKQQKSSASQTN